MTSRAPSTSSATPFLLVAALVLAVTGWLGWHMYNQPSNPDEAALKATEMTRIVVEGAGGSNTSCPALPTALSGDGNAAIDRCNSLTAYVRQLGMPPASAQDLRVAESDLHRRSGTVTVAVTVASQGQEFPMHMGWKMTWVDGHWWVNGVAGIDRG